MTAPERPAWTAYITALRDLHVAAGEPSSRAVARQTATLGESVGHVTINDALRGARIPTHRTLRRLVAVLGGNEDEFRRLLIEAEGEAARSGDEPLRGAPGSPSLVLAELVAIRAVLERIADRLEVGG
jgi:hypothetical protein